MTQSLLLVLAVGKYPSSHGVAVGTVPAASSGDTSLEMVAVVGGDNLTRFEVVGGVLVAHS